MKSKQINIRVPMDLYRRIKKAVSGTYSATISKVGKRGFELALKEMEQKK